LKRPGPGGFKHGGAQAGKKKRMTKKIGRRVGGAQEQKRKTKNRVNGHTRALPGTRRRWDKFHEKKVLILRGGDTTRRGKIQTYNRRTEI